MQIVKQLLSLLIVCAFSLSCTSNVAQDVHHESNFDTATYDVISESPTFGVDFSVTLPKEWRHKKHNTFENGNGSSLVIMVREIKRMTPIDLDYDLELRNPHKKTAGFGEKVPIRLGKFAGVKIDAGQWFVSDDTVSLQIRFSTDVAEERQESIVRMICESGNVRVSASL